MRNQILGSQERQELAQQHERMEEDAHLQAECEQVMAVSDYIRGLEAASSQVSRVEAPADDSKAAWHASCAPSEGKGHAAVEAAYEMIRDRGDTLRTERMAGARPCRDKVLSLWMSQQERRKGDYNDLRKKYYSLPDEDKVVILEKFLMSEVCAENEVYRVDAIRQLARHLFKMAPEEVQTSVAQAGRKEKQRKYFINSVSRLLLTWVGAWGRIPMDHLRHPLSSKTDIEDVCAMLCQHPLVSALWVRIQARIEEMVANVMKPHRYTVSLELCTATFCSRGEVQLHVHMFAQSASQGQPFRVERPADLALFGVPPNLGPGTEAGNLTMTAARGRSANEANAASGHYYLAMPKVGKVFPHVGNCEPWKDYGVRAAWITQHWQTNKLSDDAAVGEYVKCKNNVHQNVQNVYAHQRLKRQLQEREQVSLTQRSMKLNTAPPVFIPEVMAWMDTFSNVEMRYSFLVLEGQSCCGKTQFARALMGPEACFVADCSGKNHPDLRDFQRQKHRVLLFDEIAAQRVIEYKKLFQAGNEEVLCGSSPTNQHSYKINVHATMIIVASNKWSQQLSELSEEDHQWLALNSLHLRIFGPLWQNAINQGRPPHYSVVRAWEPQH